MNEAEPQRDKSRYEAAVEAVAVLWANVREEVTEAVKRVCDVLRRTSIQADLRREARKVYEAFVASRKRCRAARKVLTISKPIYAKLGRNRPLILFGCTARLTAANQPNGLVPSERQPVRI